MTRMNEELTIKGSKGDIVREAREEPKGISRKGRPPEP